MENVTVILEALRSGNNNKAIRTVNEELTKNPKSDVYLSLKVHVAHSLLDKDTCIQTAKEAASVCSKMTLKLFLIPALVDYNCTDTALAAFQQVDRRSPKDEEVRELWLATALEMGDLNSAQKALMALQRDAPEPRSAAFNLCTILTEIKPVQKLFPILAQRILGKFTPAKTPQECFVVAKVKLMESEEKMVEYLQDPSLKPFLGGSLELQLLLLNGLLKLEKWEELQKYAMLQLEKIDSYNYWEALNTASVKIGAIDRANEFRKSFKGLNAKLAAIDLAHKANSNLDESVLSYWSQFGAHASTSKFLQQYATEEIVNLLSSHQNKLGEKINILKLQSYLGKTHKNADLIQLYEQFKSEAPAEKTEYFIGTDSLLMAAYNLVENGCKEGAITLLEYALQVDPHQFYVRLMLIELYNSLGANLLAKMHFDSLAIKNIQYESLGYMLSTRLGSVAPKDSRPLVTKLETTRRRLPDFGEYAMATLTMKKAYTQFSGIYELGVKLRRSLWYALVQLEVLKASRINGTTPNYTELLHTYEPESELCDTRDFKTRFEGKELPQLYVGPVPHHEYVAVFRVKELALMEYIRSGVVKDETKEKVSGLFERANSSSEFTREEVYSIDVVSRMILGKFNHTEVSTPEFDLKLPLDWRFFHWAYTLLETVNTAKVFKLDIPDAKEKIRGAVSHYMNTLSDAERQFVASAKKEKLPGDASKFARKVKTEHLRKLQDLQALLK